MTKVNPGERKNRPQDMNIFPRTQVEVTLPNVIEVMRGDALTHLAEGNEVIGQWLWNLADRLAEDFRRRPTTT